MKRYKNKYMLHFQLEDNIQLRETYRIHIIIEL